MSALARIERGDSSPNWTSIRAITTTLGITIHQLTTAIENQEHPRLPAYAPRRTRPPRRTRRA